MLYSVTSYFTYQYVLYTLYNAFCLQMEQEMAMVSENLM